MLWCDSRVKEADVEEGGGCGITQGGQGKGSHPFQHKHPGHGGLGVEDALLGKRSMYATRIAMCSMASKRIDRSKPAGGGKQYAVRGVTQSMQTEWCQ